MSVYSDTILAETGLTNYWRMDDTGSTLTDSEGGNNGSVGAGVTTGVTGLLPYDDSTAMQFAAAANNICTIPNNPGSGFTAITWEFLAYPTSIPADGTFRTCVMGDSTSFYNYLQMDGDGFEVNVRTNLGQGSTTNAGVTLFQQNTLVHVAFTWSAASGQFAVYKNGSVFSGPTARTGATITDSHAGSIGATASGTDQFIGIIDEVALYNVALDATALTAHYDAITDPGIVYQTARPDADTDAGGWATAPLYSKVNDEDDGTVISDTLA